MADDINSVSRRSAFAGAGAVLLAGLAARGAAAAEMSAGEKTNVKAVADFMALWSKPEADGAKLAAHVADDCVLRMEENKPPVMGKAAAVEAFNKFLTGGTRFGITILETFAHGPLVANYRSDWSINQGKASPPFIVAGVFVMKDGKIKEWADYVVPKA